MKIILLTLLLLLAWKTTTAGQSQPPAGRVPPETLGENERLPFMTEHSEDGSANSTAEPGTGGLLFRTLGALLLIGGLIFAAAWGFKKFGAGTFGRVALDAPDLAVISTVSLGTNRSLAVVRFGAQTLLIGATAQSLTLLAAENPLIEQEFTGYPTRSVAELLAAGIDDGEISFAAELAGAINRSPTAGREI